MANQINYKINFETNTQSLDTVKKALQEIQKITTTQFEKMGSPLQGKDAVKELMSIKSTAKEVENALRNAFNVDLGTYNITKLRESLNHIGLDKVYNKLGQIKTIGPQAFQGLSTSLLTTNLQMKQSNKLLNDMAISFKNTVKWGISSSIWNNMTTSLGKAWDYTKRLDSSLNDIRVVSYQTADQMERFAQYANRAAKDLGTSTLDYTKAALIYYQQGLDGDAVTERTNATLKLANTTGEVASQVSDYMTAIWNNFEDGSHTIEYYADVLAKLGAETASSSDEIAAGLEKFASVAETVGLSYEYATSALTTITAATRQSADVVGTALKTLFSRIQDLELGNTLEDGTTLGKYSEALEKVGINIKTQSGDLKDMDDILDEMGAKWSTLNKDQQVALAQAVAGVRQYNQLMALMNNWSDMETNVERATNAAGTLNKQQDVYMESTKAHLEQLGTAAERVMDAFIDNKGMNDLIDDATSLTTLFANFVESLGGGANMLKMFGSIGTQVFSSQIATGISNIITNFKVAKNNAAALINDIEYLKTQKFSNSALSDPVYQAGLAAANKFADNKSSMTKEEMAKATDLVQEVIEVNKLADEWERAKTQAIEYARMVSTQEGFGVSNNSEGNFVSEEEILFLKDDLKEANDLEEAIEATFKKIDTIARKFGTKVGDTAGKAVQDTDAQLRTLAEDLYKYVEGFTDQVGEVNLKAAGELKNRVEGLTRKEKWIGNIENKKTGQEEAKITVNTFEQLEKIQKIKMNLFKDYEEVKGKINTYIKEEWDTETGQEKTKQLADAVENAGKKVDEFNEKLDFKDRIQGIVNLTAAFGQLSMGINTLSNLKDILDDEDLSTAEKTTQIIMALSTSIPMIVNGLQLIGKSVKVIPGVIAGMLGLTASEVSAAKAAGTLGTAIWSALLPVLPIILGITAAVAVLVGVIYSIVKAYNEDADAAKKAAEQAKNAAEAATQATEEYEKLASIFEKYDKGIKQLKDLTAGTEEYNEALKSANEAAMELIEADNSLAKYATKKNGIITFEKEDGTEFTQDELLSASKTKMNSAKAASSLAQSNANRAQQKLDYTNFLRDVDLDIDEQALKNAIATGIISVGTLGAGAPAALNAGKQSMQNTLSTDDLSVIIDQLIADGGEEVFALGKVEESLNKLSGLTDEEKRTLLEHSDKLKDLTTATIDLNATNKLLLQQSLEDSLENNKEYAGLTDNQKAAVSARYGEGLTEDVEKKLRKKAEEKWNQDAWFGGGNEDEVHQAYAKSRGWTLSQDKTGDKAVYLDKEGNAQTVEDDNARAYLINQEVQKNLKDYDKNSLDSIIKATKNINTNQFDSKYGTNLEAGILNTISSGGKLDTDALFAGISPSEIAKLEDFSGEKWKEALGLTDTEMETLGLGSGQVFAENFKKAAEENYKWDPEAAVKNAINTMETSPEDLGLDEKEFAGYAKHLMDMANETDNLADSMTEEAEAAVVVTRGIMRMNQGIDKLAKGQEEWIDILKNSSRTSQEYYDALTDMQDALADILDTEEDYISETFVRDHLEDIQKAADGDAEAIDRLHKALAVDMVAHIAVDNGLDEGQVQNLINQVQGLQIPDIEVGAKLDSSQFSNDEKAFLDQMLEIVENAKMTADEANEFFGQMGFDANFETHPEKITRQVPVTITESEITSVFPLKMRSSSYQKGTQPITETIEVPSLSSNTKNSYKGIKSITRRATGSFNNYSPVNSGGKSAGGGGSSKETKYNTSNDKADIYQEVNTQLQSTNDELKKIQSQTDKLTGLELIQNINEQIQNLNKNLDLTNKKLRIAQGEQQGFISQLQGYGVGLNADGSINQQSYVEAFYREQSRYTSATTEDEAAKKRWEDFKQLITDYNNSVKNIDSLKQNIQDSLDKITDLKIQAFNMEIEVTLDLDDARKQWEEFKKDVIDKIEDDDILGNAQYNLDSLNRFYDEQGLGKIQEETKYLTKLLNELKTMDATGSADSYDENRKKALEDLQKYYEQTMSDLTDIEDVIDEIEKSLGETLDDISDQMQDQLKAYEQLSDTLDHDMKLIQLVFGEDSYSKLEDYYAKKEQNFNSRLDFQKQQVEFWEQQMTVLEEGSKEWEKARDNWMSAVNDWQSNIESAIENLQDKYLNAINAIFDNLNNQLTNGKGLAYINEEWELINKNADRYLDTINSQYGIQTLQQKYLDAIDKTNSLAGQKKLTKLMNEQVEALKAQDKLSQADLDRADLKYQIAVKRLQLEEAQQNKSTIRLRRDSQGNYSYQYTADEDETSKLESELSNLYNQLYNFDKDQYTANLEEMYAIWEEYQQKMTEAMQINDPEQREARKLLITQQYEELINGIVRDNEKIKQELHESTFLELADLYDEDYGKYASLAEAEQEILMDQMIPQWNTGIQEMIDKFAGEGGFGPTCEEALNKLAETTEQYETDLGKLQEAAAVSFEEIAKSIDPVLEKTGQLVKDNDALFSSYQKQVDAINNVLNALRNLTAQYEGARKAASDAAEASYKYWEEQQRQAQAAAAKNDSAKVDQQAKNGGGSGSSSGGGSGGQYSGYRLGGRSYTIRRGDTLWGIARSQYGNAGLWSEIWNNNRGNLRSGNPNLIYPGEVIRLDTGGYTGEWNSADGKLAMLHQKELVLNAQDTENILSAVSMMRSMLSNIGSQSLGQIQNSESAFEQNVHIEASFPNVSSTHEIEAALNNLVNAATQHIHNNKR